MTDVSNIIYCIDTRLVSSEILLNVCSVIVVVNIFIFKRSYSNENEPINDYISGCMCTYIC